MAKLDDISIRETSAGLIRPLRHAVLRAGLPEDAAVFDGDDEPMTRHVGAFNSSGEVVGCVTIVCRPWNDETAWQLRGMAIKADLRDMGIGRRLMSKIDEIVLATGVTPLLWCNARTPAVGFYKAMGWQQVGEQFHIETAGPHFQMFRRLRA